MGVSVTVQINDQTVGRLAIERDHPEVREGSANNYRVSQITEGAGWVQARVMGHDRADGVWVLVAQALDALCVRGDRS